ncbi:hypothetical protein Q9233_007261 [Columba guinea]|nr:hypothetical protein Q9233_007261 [Columba guinea]
MPGSVLQLHLYYRERRQSRSVRTPNMEEHGIDWPTILPALSPWPALALPSLARIPDVHLVTLKYPREGHGTLQAPAEGEAKEEKPAPPKPEPKPKKAAPKKEKAANDKKEDKKAATKGKKGAKGKDETKQEDAKEENHSENGDTKTNEAPAAEASDDKEAKSE